MTDVDGTETLGRLMTDHNGNAEDIVDILAPDHREVEQLFVYPAIRRHLPDGMRLSSTTPGSTRTSSGP